MELAGDEKDVRRTKTDATAVREQIFQYRSRTRRVPVIALAHSQGADASSERTSPRRLKGTHMGSEGVHWSGVVRIKAVVVLSLESVENVDSDPSLGTSANCTVQSHSPTST